VEAEAIEWMKAGAAPSVVYDRLLARGVADSDARAIIDKLIVLKRQAEAMDPARLREEAKWMLFRGAPIEHVVAHFTAMGITPEHARPEAERIAAAVRQMVPCQRCASPVLAEEAFFDPQGRRVCKRCNTMDTIDAGERRVVENVLEMVGLPAIAAQSMSGAQNAAYRQAPWCARCQRASGVHVNALPPQYRAQVHPGWLYVCGFCMQGLG
jgi:hypothetical protein